MEPIGRGKANKSIRQRSKIRGKDGTANIEEEQRGEVRKVKEPNLTVEVVQEELHHTWTKGSHKNVSGLRGMSRGVAREVGFCSTVPWSNETL